MFCNTRFRLAFSIIYSGLFFLLIVWFFPPFWETNDDPIMAMRAHGFGNMLHASANIQFSNIIWGWFVHLMPSFGGVLGYSILTAFVLLMTLIGLSYSACEIHSSKGKRVSVLIAVISFVLIVPIVFPQFTINSGLLICASIFSLMAYEKEGRKRFLFMAFIYLFIGLLVRDKMAVLTLVVAAPLIKWNRFFLKKEFIACSILLLLLIILSKWMHFDAYSSEEWNDFNELQNARIYWMDYRGFHYLLKKPDLYSQYDLSGNDIELLRRWFFADPELNNPARLVKMKNNLQGLFPVNDRIYNGWVSLKILFSHEKLYPLTLIGLMLLVLYPSKKVMYAWIISIAAIFYFGWIGRPGMTRVYVPILILLVLAPCFIYSYNARIKSVIILRIMKGFIGVLVFVHLSTAFHTHKERLLLNEKMQADINIIYENKPEGDYLVTWGHLFPFEIVYPVYGRDSEFRNFKIYGLGNGTLNPNGVAYGEESNSRGLIAKLVSEENILIYANQHRIDVLGLYCLEHYNMSYSYRIISNTKAATLFDFKCARKNNND